MKKSLLISLLIVVLATSANATIRTVSNVAGSGSQFNTIQAAVDASADGDTLYISGSTTPYVSCNITDKFLTLIGPGWAPDKNLPLQAIINSMVIRNTASAGSPGGTELQGLTFPFGGTATLSEQNAGDLTYTSLRLIRCQFDCPINFFKAISDLLVEGCMFSKSITFFPSLSCPVNNALFQNNLFYGDSDASIFNLRTNLSNVLFDHNLFYSANNLLAFRFCEFFNFTNNIFLGRNLGHSEDIANSTFTNNITFLCGTVGDSIWLRRGNTGAGNIASQNPQMANQASIQAGSYSGLLNFTIAAGPANNAGTDGKDLGLLFDPIGNLNWANSRSSRLPRIFLMNLVNTTVAAGTNINIVVEAKKTN
ncbi:hypothetical protein BH09BAC2_BH09BAC2_14980 [soil metagenome]